MILVIQPHTQEWMVMMHTAINEHGYYRSDLFFVENLMINIWLDLGMVSDVIEIKH